MKLFHIFPMIAAASAMSPCITSADCEDGEVCNMDQAGSYCESCPGDTNEDCIDAGYNMPLGTAECQSVCVEDAESESSCMTSADCEDVEVCNMDQGEAGGYCELCPGETVDDCIDATYITALGTAECQSVCVDDAASASSCKTSADCEDGEVCNMNKGHAGGFCELCPGETTEDCLDVGNITPLGLHECQSVCVDDATTASSCITSADCEDGEVCNMDEGEAGGFCELCPGETYDECAFAGFISPLGTAECQSVCVDYAASASTCITSADCGDGEMCNMDHGEVGGYCELCPGDTIDDCIDATYITPLGFAECESVCFVGKIIPDDEKSGFQVNSVSLVFVAAMTIFK